MMVASYASEYVKVMHVLVPQYYGNTSDGKGSLIAQLKVSRSQL